jgi:acyl-CoA dehydrogenase
MGDNKLNEKTNRRFDAATLAAISRIFAREAALKVATDGVRWVVGAGGLTDAEIPAFQDKIGAAAINRAQAGLIVDQDAVADALYGRTAARQKAAA